MIELFLGSPMELQVLLLFLLVTVVWKIING
jgi:hypothetical protein